MSDSKFPLQLKTVREDKLVDAMFSLITGAIHFGMIFDPEAGTSSEDMFGADLADALKGQSAELVMEIISNRAKEDPKWCGVRDELGDALETLSDFNTISHRALLDPEVTEEEDLDAKRPVVVLPPEVYDGQHSVPHFVEELSSALSILETWAYDGQPGDEITLKLGEMTTREMNELPDI